MTGGLLSVLRPAGLVAVVLGALGSVGFLLRAPQRPSLLLLVLLALWGLSPFIAVVLADVVSKRWPVLTRATLYCLMLVIALGYLVMDGDADLRPAGKPAGFVFVVVPLVSWLLIVIIVPIAALVSRRRSRRGDGALKDER